MPKLLWLEGAVKVGDLHRPEGPACRLNELFLNAPVRAYEKDFAAGDPLLQEPCQRQCGIDMARCAAAS